MAGRAGQLWVGLQGAGGRVGSRKGHGEQGTLEVQHPQLLLLVLNHTALSTATHPPLLAGSTPTTWMCRTAAPTSSPSERQLGGVLQQLGHSSQARQGSVGRGVQLLALQQCSLYYAFLPHQALTPALPHPPHPLIPAASLTS